ncbi:MAG TPA: nuclear transport factor 2 family protein [Thermoanaerobaculia bacterium]
MRPGSAPRWRIVLAFAVLIVARRTVADDLDEIVRLNREITVATWTGDAVWFEENVADDYVLVTPSGVPYTKRDVIREVSTPGLKMNPYEPVEVQVRLYGDSAIVVGRIMQRFTIGRVRYANDLRYTSVYAKRRGRWLLVGGHTSNVAVGH